MKLLNLSSEQASIENHLVDFILGDSDRIAALTGWAGTGKTSLISSLLSREELNGIRIQVMAPTGKAASVLAKKLPGWTVETVHKSIYTPFEDESTGKVMFSWKGLDPNIDLVICDEASMVSSKMAKDLETSTCKILYVGDPGQLPPVANSKGHSCLDQDTVFHLDEIHRQAQDSPIINLAHTIRTGRGMIPLRMPKCDEITILSEFKARSQLDDLITNSDVLLCGYNNTRRKLNERARSLYGRSGTIAEGDWLCVLKNHPIKGVMNGERYRVLEIDNNPEYRVYDAIVESEWGYIQNLRFYVWSDEEDDVDLNTQMKRGKSEPGSPVVVDYGYALTVHKSQGSEWKDVTIFDEPTRGQAREWRYTAVTRSSKNIVYVR